MEPVLFGCSEWRMTEESPGDRSSHVATVKQSYGNRSAAYAAGSVHRHTGILSANTLFLVLAFADGIYPIRQFILV